MKLLKVGEYSGEPDLSIAGHERRLLATRTAIRYRNPETGKRHFCHLANYRPIYARSVRAMRRTINELKAST